jgi:hypothetical protein
VYITYTPHKFAAVEVQRLSLADLNDVFRIIMRGLRSVVKNSIDPHCYYHERDG